MILSELPAPKTAQDLRLVVAEAVKQANKYTHSPFGNLFDTMDNTMVAFYPALEPDGVDVVVYAASAPAYFYEIWPLDDSGTVLTTGSGMESLTVEIAKALAESMLVLKVLDGGS